MRGEGNGTVREACAAAAEREGRKFDRPLPAALLEEDGERSAALLLASSMIFMTFARSCRLTSFGSGWSGCCHGCEIGA